MKRSRVHSILHNTLVTVIATTIAFAGILTNTSVVMAANTQSGWSFYSTGNWAPIISWLPKVVFTPTPEPTPTPAPEPTPEPTPAPTPEPGPVPPDQNASEGSSQNYADSLVADFAQRDAMPETLVPKSKWDSYGKWGPPAAKYPMPVIPAGYDRLQWQRDRIVAVAQKYIGKVPYAHKHIPSLGLDCSNFTAWVYNYGLGNKFTSAVKTQGATVGRRLAANEPLLPGDLLFFKNSSGTITHAAIYIKPGYMIDESGNVAQRRFPYGWTKTAFAYARRVIE